MSESVKNYQMKVMQSFFKIRMNEAFGTDWINKVRDVVEEKFATDDRYKSNYKGIHCILDEEGIEILDEKEMEVTNISSLLLNDFLKNVKWGLSFGSILVEYVMIRIIW